MKEPDVPGLDNDYTSLSKEESLERFKQNCAAIDAWAEREQAKSRRLMRWCNVCMWVAVVALFTSLIGIPLLRWLLK